MNLTPVLLRDMGERRKLCLVRWYAILPSEGVQIAVQRTGSNCSAEGVGHCLRAYPETSDFCNNFSSMHPARIATSIKDERARALSKSHLSKPDGLTYVILSQA